MMDEDGDPSDVNGASGATCQPSKPALPAAPFNPLYQIVFPLHWHQLFPSTLYPFSSMYNNMFFIIPTHFYIVRFTSIRSNAEPKFSFMILTEFICWHISHVYSISSYWI